MLWLALALVACTALVLWRAERVVLAYFAHAEARDQRRVALDEARTKAPDRKAPMPPELAAIAEQEREPWAREQVRAAIQDQYEEYGDWDAVRNSLFGAR